MNDISPTLNCKNIVKQRKLKGLPVYNFGLGENPLPINNYYHQLVTKYSYKKHYTSASGVIELQKTIKNKYSNKYYTVDNIIVGNGLKELLFLVQLAFKGKIIHITPSWLSYKEQINILNKNNDLLLINTTINNEYKVLPSQLEKALDSVKNHPKLIIFNNPNNPTSVIYNEKEVQELANVLNKYNCVVFADEIYFNLTHGNQITSISEFIPHLTIRGSSVSKDLACGGFRLGWITFPKELNQLFKKCNSYASSIYSSANTIMQYSTADMIANEEEFQQNNKYANNIFKYISNEACKILDTSKLLYIKPQSSWYIFINFRNYEKKLRKININDSYTLSEFLKNKFGIITVPGICFSNYEITLRLSLVDINVNINMHHINFLKNIKEGLFVLINFLSKI